jgi:hypothetical protein
LDGDVEGRNAEEGHVEIAEVVKAGGSIQKWGVVSARKRSGQAGDKVIAEKVIADRGDLGAEVAI